jgi:hypothetical protein
MQSLQGKESIRFSETSFSPRFNPYTQPNWQEKPEEQSRDLIKKLEKGMA